MASLMIADSFKPQLARLMTEPPQSLLLHGDVGVGLGSVARQIAGPSARIMQPVNKQGEPDFETGTISVESIRLLYEQTRAKSISWQTIIIESADLMSPGAQNAFLKLLEEPSSSVRFILTTHHKDHLLSTILSRVQSHHIPRISDSQSKLLLSKLSLDEGQHARVLFLANGRPGLLHELATDDNRLQQMSQTIIDAREFITKPKSYTAFVLAIKYSKTRRQAEHFVDALMTILRHTLYTAPHVETISMVQQIETTRINLSANANPKLQLMRLVLK